MASFLRLIPWAFAAVLLMDPCTAWAQALEGLDVRALDGAYLIHIRFSTVTRYESHFPADSGRILEINVRPLELGEPKLKAPPRRKSLNYKPNGEFPLQDVTFDPDGPLGDRVVVRFAAPVRFTVSQGLDNRSIDVIVQKSAAKPGSAAEFAPGTQQAPSKEEAFAVTLVTSFKPITNLARIRESVADIPRTHVYATEADVLGQTLHFVRLGFFPTFEEAAAVRDRLLSKYPLAWATSIAPGERDAALRRTAVPVPGAAAPPTAEPRSRPATTEPKVEGDYPYVVNLLSTPAGRPPASALPAKLAGLRLYTTQTQIGDRTWHRLRLGFFATQAAAEQVRRQLLKRYPDAWIDLASVRERQESVNTAYVVGDPKFSRVSPGAAATAKPELEAAPRLPPQLAAPEPVEPAPDGVARLMDQGRAALTAGDNVGAIRVFTRVLQLPEGPYTPDAQEFLGVARERNGQTDLAIVEYTLYLKRWPEGEGAARVRQRLAALTKPVPTAALIQPKQEPSTGQTDIYGTISQQYYKGNSKIDTTTQLTPTVTEQATLSATDQKAVFSNIDLTARYRSSVYDNRFVFSGQWYYDLLPVGDNDTNITAAYAEIKNRELHLRTKVGRQPGTSGGVLGRFDGALVGYRLLPKWTLNVVAGTPVDTVARGSDRKFYGINADVGLFDGHWSGNLYYFEQTVDGLLDRQAVGAEVRYFDERSSFFSLLDYDTGYDALNTFLFQGNWQSQANTAYNVLVDYRKAPPLQTTNALLGEPVDSIRALRQWYSDEEIRSLAEQRTPTSRMLAFGAVHPLNPRFQLGGDVTLTNIAGTETSGTPPAAVVPGVQGTGNVMTYSAKLIGSGLWQRDDVSVLTGAVTDGNTFDAVSLALTHRFAVNARFRTDLTLRQYNQDNAVGSELRRTAATLRLDYRIRRNVSLEFEGTREISHVDSATQNDKTVRDFFALGYRWDF